MNRNSYLIRNRLEDVIFLIQYLGLDEKYSLTKGTDPDQVSPRSVSDKMWATVAREHPEFFRVMEKSDSVTLSLRYFMRTNGETPPLPVATVQQLIENAFSLHERQMKRAEVWKTWATLIAALVAAGSGIAQFFIHPR